MIGGGKPPVTGFYWNHCLNVSLGLAGLDIEIIPELKRLAKSATS